MKICLVGQVAGEWNMPDHSQLDIAVDTTRDLLDRLQQLVDYNY